MKEFNNYEQTMRLIERVENGEKFLKVFKDYRTDLEESLKHRNEPFEYKVGMKQAEFMWSLNLAINLLVAERKLNEQTK